MNWEPAGMCVCCLEPAEMDEELSTLTWGTRLTILNDSNIYRHRACRPTLKVLEPAPGLDGPDKLTERSSARQDRTQSLDCAQDTFWTSLIKF